jgi:hypothetical protein
MKLVARHSNVQGEGVGRVMSEGVYFMLQAYTVCFFGRSLVKEGENFRSARPLVGVVYY